MGFIEMKNCRKTEDYQKTEENHDKTGAMNDSQTERLREYMTHFHRDETWFTIKQSANKVDFISIVCVWEECNVVN